MVFIPAKSLLLEPGEVALSLAPGTYGSHAGIVYRDDPTSNRLVVLHLLDNEFARVDAFPGGMCWVAAKLDITPTTGMFLEEYLRDVGRELPKARIKYGIDVMAAEGSFTKSGYVQPEGSDGLTCATFVWQILRYGSLNPIVAETWPEGGNGEWAMRIALRLIYTAERRDPDQGYKIANQWDKARRVKPTDLGVPACYPVQDWPFQYDRVAPEEPSIKRVLNHFCPVA